MFSSILAVVGAAVLVWLATAFRERRQIGGTFPQALKFSQYKFLYGLRIKGLPPAAETRGPVLYCILEQSGLDRAILQSVLPIETFHLTPDMVDSQGHNLIRSVLTSQGYICLYLPPQVESSVETQALLRDVGAIARDTNTRIQPLYIRGTRHSLWSHATPEQAPRTLLPQMVLAAAPEFSLSGYADQAIADRMMDGMTLAKFNSMNFSTNLFETLVASARLFGPGREILLDALGGKLSYRSILVGARALGNRYRALSKPGEAVGVLLPNTNVMVMSIFGLLSGGRIAAMLNYTAGPAAIGSALRTASIGTVISSRAFIEKASLEALVKRIETEGVRLVYVEDLSTGITLWEKLLALLLWRRPIEKRSIDAPALILFTSGSEGTPKGVVLSSRNLIANAVQADCRIDISSTDMLFNVLPAFHSFGMLGGTLLPLLFGITLYQYPSPIHYKIIPGVARKLKPTIMFGTDTFLHAYGKAAKEGDFDSLRLIVAGAEAVREPTRTLFRERFNAEIVEGYGMTEASPVVAVNSSSMQKEGSVGRLLPGMEMMTEVVEGIDEGVKLLISGPNVMLGYLYSNRPGEVQMMSGPWHDTGDIVAIDERGFISIVGRAKRFAKIAGEMVSLGAVEIMVQHLWPEDEHAAIALPDKRKGERIVLVTTKQPAVLDELRRYSRSFGATELMVPQDIVSVEQIPVLGSGKTDYVSAEKLAAERLPQ